MNFLTSLSKLFRLSSFILSLLFYLTSFGQTFTFSGYTTGQTFTTNGYAYTNTQAGTTMTAKVITTGAPNWTNLTGSNSPHNSGYWCSTTGLTLSTNRATTTPTVGLDLSFSPSICSPVTFSIYDINGQNVDISMGYGFRDDITISAWDGSNNPIALTTSMVSIPHSSCDGGSYGNAVQTSGNNLIVYGCSYGDCGNDVFTITSPNTISRIYINYASGTKDYGGVTVTDPAEQHIIIGNITTTPLPVTVNSPAICAGSSTTLTANGGATYLWNTGATTASISVSPGSTTTYTVIGTSASGCKGTATSTVTVSSPPVVAVVAAPATICAGASTTLTGSGATSYVWNTGPTTPAILVSPAVTTIYTVTGTNPGCPGVPANVTVNVNATPIVTASNSGNICGGGSTTLTGGGASSYSWSGGAGAGSPVTVSPSSSTTYTVTGTAVNGCTATATTLVNVSPLPTVSASPSVPNPCPSDPVVLTPVVGITPSVLFSENFETGNSLTLLNQNTNVWIRGTAAGAACAGAGALYVSNNGAAYAYTVGSLITPQPNTTNHAYFDVIVPACYTSANLAFSVKVQGTAAADYVQVWSCPKTFTPIVGILVTAVGGNTLLGQYNTIACTNVNFAIPTGGTRRIIFTWRNNTTTGTQGPGLIDNIVVTGTTTVASYAWTSTSGFSSALANPTDNPTLATTYTVNATTSCGCSNTANTSVTMCITLPIELRSFTGKCENGKKLIEWITSTEINNSYFTIEQSTDGVNFREAIQVQGAGNSNENRYYQTTLNLTDGFDYFRLKQTDYDGQFSYSEPIHVKCDEANNNSIAIFPNPALDQITINFDLKNNKGVVGQIINVIGERILSFSNKMLSEESLTLSVKELSAGLYNLTLFSAQTGEILGSSKFIKK